MTESLECQIDIIDRANRALWNAIPCHVDYDTYLASHPQKDAVLETQRRVMRAALEEIGVIP